MMIQIGFGDPWIPQHGNAANAKVFYFIEIVVIFVLFPLSAYGIKSCAFGLSSFTRGKNGLQMSPIIISWQGLLTSDVAWS